MKIGVPGPDHPCPIKAVPSTVDTGATDPFVLDTRPIFAQGGTPCTAIDNAVASLSLQQPLVLLVPFEPVPLYSKLGRVGFNHQTSRLEDGTWKVVFTRETAAG